MILASASPRRRELMLLAGYTPRVIPADVDETRLPGESPVELVERLARAKAHAEEVIGAATPLEAVVAADTIVWIGDECLGKPVGADDARSMLKRLSGTVHNVTTGVCLLAKDAAGEIHDRVFSETTEVTFYEVPDAQIDAYVRTGEPMDKAGAYAIQGGGRLFVDRIDGNYENVVGLPLARLVREFVDFARNF